MTASPRISDCGAEERPPSKAPGGLGMRHLQILFIFCGITAAYSLRVNMSVAIVAMVDRTTANPDFEDYDWDESTQSFILSSFFWGYVFTQIPSGQIAHLWSAQKLWSIAMFVCGVMNILIPPCASYGGWGAVCACRVIMGLSQGCVLPCIHTLLGKWVPPSERGRLGTYAYAGAQFGTVIAMPICGLLAASAIGWPGIFYIFGVITIIWAIVFFVWGSDSPGTHPSISSEEKRYIEDSFGPQQDEADGSKKKLSPPWKAIFTSVPVWALVIVHCGQNWGYWTLLTEMPSYLKSVLNFDIAKNGLISALPYLAMWILSFPASWFSDFILNKGWASRGVVRKVSNTIGHWGPAIFLIALGYMSNDNTNLAVAVLVISVGLNAGSICGYQINHIDLSPNYGGTLMSITNCIAGIMSILAPLICGFIITDSSDVTQWRTVFFIAAGIYFLGNLAFILFGQAEVQPWNEPQRKGDFESAKERPNQEIKEHK